MNHGRRTGPAPAPMTMQAQLEALAARVRTLETRLQEVEARSQITSAESAQLTQRVEQSGKMAVAHHRVLGTHGDSLAAHTADIDALFTSGDATSRVANEAKAELAALKGQVTALQAQFDATQTDALYLANLAYAYALMSQHWVVARDRVRAVIGEPTTGQTLLRVSSALLAGGIQLALTSATGGLASGLFDAFGGPVVKLFTGLAKTVGQSKYSTASDGDYSDIEGDLAKDTSGPVLDSVMGLFVDGLSPKPWEPADIAGTMTDPLQFFLDLEKELRRAAMKMANTRGNAALRGNIKSSLNESNLTALEADPFWKFLFRPMNADTEKNWTTISTLLGARMRRLAWRMYCRAQWNNNLWDNTVRVDSSFKDPTDSTNAWQVEDPADWPRKVWTSQGGGWPAHWEVICSDFRGPEHIPSHPMNALIGQAEITKAALREKRMAWISMAVVQCCQIKREFGITSRAFRIDLERNIHVAGLDASDEAGNDNGFGAVNGRTVDIYRALFDTETVARPLCEAIMTTGGVLVRITEIRFGTAGSRLMKASGKKGRLNAPNRVDDIEMWNVAPGSRITICVSSTEKTTRDAKIYLLNPTQLAARNGAGDFPSQIAKAEKNFATSTSQWTNLNAPTAPGKYCVTLSSRNDLRKEGSVRARQMHVPSEWWFEVKA